MRKKFVAGNWKMNTTAASAVELAGALAKEVGSLAAVDVALCPPFVYLSQVAAAVAGMRIALAAQKMSDEFNGAFTGEISGEMLKNAGRRYVILGHSERRHVIGESDELINRKVIKALGDGLEPIFCVASWLAQREANQTLDVVSHQVKVGLGGVSRDQASKVTLAYEPVWAIGTGKVALPAQAQEVHAMIRQLLERMFGKDLAGAMRIQYGGSVQPSNSAELLAQADIDGAWSGGQPQGGRFRGNHQGGI